MQVALNTNKLFTNPGRPSLSSQSTRNGKDLNLVTMKKMMMKRSIQKLRYEGFVCFNCPCSLNHENSVYPREWGNVTEGGISGIFGGSPNFFPWSPKPDAFLSVKSVQECRNWFLEALVSNVMEPCTFNFSPDPWSPNPIGPWRDGWHFRLPKYSAHSVLHHVEEKQNQNFGWKRYPCGKFCYNQEIALTK